MIRISLSFLIALIIHTSLAAQNKFTDPVMQKIYTLKDERKTKELLPYLKDKNERYREAATQAFASVQDEEAIDALIKLLADKSEKVRMAAAFSLGQAKDSTAVKDMQNAYKKEASFNVKGALLEAMGKCGTAKTLAFIVEQSYYPENTAMNNGIARALFHLANKKIVSPAGTAKAIELIGKPYSSIVRQNASAYLARARGIDLNPHMKNIERSLTDEDVNVRMNLARAIGKLSSSAALEFATVLLDDKDYRVKVNALNALKNFEPEIVRAYYMSVFPTAKDPHVSLTAAEGILKTGIASDAAAYYKMAMSSKDFRTRSVMYQAALKYAEPAGKDTIYKALVKLYSGLTDNYEKGMLLTALSEHTPAHSFIASQTFSTEAAAIRTYGMEALTSIRKQADFGRKDTSLFTTFDQYFRKAIMSGDVAMIAIASAAMQDTSVASRSSWKKGTPKINFTDLKFMDEALAKLVLPRDIETYMELQHVIDYYKGTKSKEAPKSASSHPINWVLVTSLSEEPTVNVSTTKGDFVMKLFTNDAPGSVANFMELVNSRYYDGKIFHRVVPNFVVQTGCPRGDGWGNTDYTIRSEFAPLSFETGYLGMASAGKDTEGPQWFITHSPTPHLDGNYTVFGKVMEGMEVIHALGVGDRIIAITIK
jgi:cyclophilin family peptidyl-prolyl cis-trans isomerase/HEAT repeat protein